MYAGGNLGDFRIRAPVKRPASRDANWKACIDSFVNRIAKGPAATRGMFRMKWMQWVGALLVLSLSGGALAAAIGLPESTARIGYAAGVSRLSVDDPDGSTEAAVDVQQIGRASCRERV